MVWRSPLRSSCRRTRRSGRSTSSTQGSRCVGGVCVFSTLTCSLSSQFSLSVTPTLSSFPLGQYFFSNGQPSFSAQLTNNSGSQAYISATDVANITVVYVTDPNGITLTDFDTPTEFARPPDTIAKAALAPVANGSYATFTISGVSDLTRTPDGGVYGTRSFYATTSGTYRAKFRYQYSGPDNSYTGVFHGVVESQEVSFNVQ